MPLPLTIFSKDWNFPRIQRHCCRCRVIASSSKLANIFGRRSFNRSGCLVRMSSTMALSTTKLQRATALRDHIRVFHFSSCMCFSAARSFFHCEHTKNPLPGSSISWCITCGFCVHWLRMLNFLFICRLCDLFHFHSDPSCSNSWCRIATSSLAPAGRLANHNERRR